jgi:hypothetical protein
MACHILDPVFMALKLKYPTHVEGSSSQVNTESAPMAEKVTYTFPKRDKFMNVDMPEVKVTWYDGGLFPERPEELADGAPMGDGGNGALFVGTKGKIMCDCYARNPRILGRENNPPKVKEVLRRVKTTHEMDWVRACKESPENRVQPSSNFEYSGPLNEMVVMGNLAVRLQGLRRQLDWDGKNMKFTNINKDDEIKVVTTDTFKVINGHPHFNTQYETMNAYKAAEEWVKHNYRKGWKVGRL